MRTVVNKSPKDTIGVDELNIRTHFIAFYWCDTYGFFVSDITNGGFVKPSLKGHGERHFTTLKKDFKEDIKSMLADGAEVFAFTSRKEFYQWLADHCED